MDKVGPDVCIRLKQIFPRIKKTDTIPFKFQFDDLHCADLVWFMERYPLRMTDEDRQRLIGGKKAYDQMQTDLERIFTPDYIPSSFIGLREGQSVRAYQAQTVDLTYARRGVLCGDDVGLGKTYTAAALFLKAGTLPGAVVTKTHLQKQWRKKLTEFTTLTTHIIKSRKPYPLPPADVYIFRYSQLMGWADVFVEGFFKAVAWDEIQELRKGTASEKGIAAKKLADNVLFRLGLSATPIYNYGNEIWNIYQYINNTMLGSYGDFSREWMVDGDRVKDPDALGSFLRDQHVLVRRSKGDVGQQMDAVNRVMEAVECDEERMHSIQEKARALALRTISGSFMERGQAGRELDLMVRMATGISKATAVAQMARIFLEQGVPILLVGWHRSVYDIWLKELAEFSPAMYTGSETPKQKEQAEEDFKSGRTNCLILSLRSADGIDGLQYRCSTVIHGEFDWSKEIHKQIEGRLDREGQPEKILSLYCYCEEGSDPPIMDLIAVKADQSRGILTPGVMLQQSTPDYSRVRLIAEQYLTKKEMQKETPLEEEQMVLI